MDGQNLEKTLSTESENSSRLIAHLISVSFTTIIFTVKVFTLGLIIVDTKVTGEQIKCMVKTNSKIF